MGGGGGIPAVSERLSVIADEAQQRKDASCRLCDDVTVAA